VAAGLDPTVGGVVSVAGEGVGVLAGASISSTFVGVVSGACGGGSGAGVADTGGAEDEFDMS